MISTKYAKEKGLMGRIAKEIITDRLCLDDSKQNIELLTDYLTRFEGMVEGKRRMRIEW